MQRKKRERELLYMKPHDRPDILYTIEVRVRTKIHSQLDLQNSLCDPIQYNNEKDNI